MKPIRLLLTLAASVAGTFLAIQIFPQPASAQGGKVRYAASPVCGKSGIERL